MRKGLNFYLISILISIIVFGIGFGIYHLSGQDFNFSIFKAPEIFHLESGGVSSDVVLINNNVNEEKLNFQKEIFDKYISEKENLAAIEGYGQIVNIDIGELSYYTWKSMDNKGGVICGYYYEIEDGMINLYLGIGEKYVEEESFFNLINSQYIEAMFFINSFLTHSDEFDNNKYLDIQSEAVRKGFRIWKEISRDRERVIDEI